MNRRPSLTSLAALAILIAAVALFLWSRTVRLNRLLALDALAIQQTALDAEFRDVQRHHAEVAHDSGRAPGADRGNGTGAAAPKGRLSVARMISRVMNDPKLQTEYLGAKRANLDWAYGPLFKQLQLAPEQRARLEDLLMRNAEQTLDLVSAAPELQSKIVYTRFALAVSPLTLASALAALPTAPTANAALQLLDQQNTAFAAAAESVLGSNGFQAYLTYERSWPVREAVVNDLVGHLAAVNPLTDDQSNQLTNALANSVPQFQSGGSAQFGLISWPQALAQARSFLSPPQFAQLSHFAAPAEARDALQAAVQNHGP